MKLKGLADIKIKRDPHGVYQIKASCERDAYYAMGYCHAKDRGMQMLLTRILGRGQGSQYLEASDELLNIDQFFRRMNAIAGTTEEEAKLSPEGTRLCRAYCEGVNARFAKGIPLELKLIGYRPDPWTTADSVLTARLMGFIGMAQSQGEIERLLVQMVQSGVTRNRLEELFPGAFEGFDEELIRKVKLSERIVPDGVLWNSLVPRMMASNNWVVAGSKTASGKPILANDPHLEVNRLPNVWYEIVLRTPEQAVYSATMPGVPGILISRTDTLAWGATYTFMDAIDSWVEDCRDGKFRRRRPDGGDDWIPFRVRQETIHRKKGRPVQLTFYENDHGVLDGNPHDPGMYLATRWSSSVIGAQSLDAIASMWHAKNVREGMERIGKLEPSFNWVMADTEGNIGHQMSGLMPKRRAGISGLVPLPGWLPENDWAGFVDSLDLPRKYNPPEGVIVTANQDLNAWGNAKPINAPMGPYRANRVSDLLASMSARAPLTVEDMFVIQYDVHSLQAEAFMAILRPLLPTTPNAALLGDWDYRYDPASQGAVLFERFYRALLQEVFGRNGLGDEVCAYLSSETPIFADFYDCFDRVLLSEHSEWFGAESRDALYHRVAEAALLEAPTTWGSLQQLTLKNIFFGGKLPRFLGFDRGPITIPGGRATVSQGQILRAGGRDTCFLPSIRVVTDLATPVVRTNLAGGPSDRRFSRWYANDLDSWTQGLYKTLRVR